MIRNLKAGQLIYNARDPNIVYLVDEILGRSLIDTVHLIKLSSHPVTWYSYDPDGRIPFYADTFTDAGTSWRRYTGGLND